MAIPTTVRATLRVIARFPQHCETRRGHRRTAASFYWDTHGCRQAKSLRLVEGP